MTQPLPDAAAQKQAAVEVFAQYEPPLYEAYLEMLTEWLAAVRAAMFAGGVAKLALVPDPFTVFTQTPKWTALIDTYSADVAREVLAAPYKDLLGEGVLFESRPFVRNFIAQRVNKLKNTPTEVYHVVAQIIDSATVNGASIPDVQAQVQELLDATNGDTWKNRAQTVARTEVVGAYNGGLHDAFSMIVERDSGTKWMKRWLATEDHRTRPDHREADGQLVPFGQPFMVGGFPMMHPHDPAAPAKEVVNCRCVELLEKEGEPTSMTNRQSLGAAVALSTTLDADCVFCLETHKPGLCKGQKRGGLEPGQVDQTTTEPAKKAQAAVTALARAVVQAQHVEAQAMLSDPKLAQAARRAAQGYAKAMRIHQQTLREVARTNATNQRTAQRDERDQDSINRQAKSIQERRAEQEKLAKMTPKQRAAYHKARAAQSRAKRRLAEQDVLNRAEGR